MDATQPGLIFDVGLSDGGDTAYYLFRGFRVVAVDANPLAIDRAKLRFSHALAAGRLTLVNAAISEQRGPSVFWVSDVPEWSSFDRSIASRAGTGHRAVVVQGLPFRDLLSTYGVPHYLKVDIEGHDRLCVETLGGLAALPAYISVEAECVGDSDVLTDEEAVAMLELLRDVGYRRFKLVDQARGWTPVRPGVVRPLVARALSRSARSRLLVPGLRGVAAKLADEGRIAALGFPFTPGSSGPWGEDVPGGWMRFEAARATYLRERHQFFSKGRPLYSFWYDWHAGG